MEGFSNGCKAAKLVFVKFAEIMNHVHLAVVLQVHPSIQRHAGAGSIVARHLQEQPPVLEGPGVGLRRHLYQRAYDLPSTSAKQEWRSVWWVFLLAAYFVAVGALRNAAFESGAWAGAAAVLASYVLLFGFLWWTPRFLLARQLSWRHALPSAVVTSIGLILTAIWSVIWLPQIIVDNAERFGAIGITFGIFTWLYATSLALVAGAVVAGAIEDVRLDRHPEMRSFPV